MPAVARPAAVRSWLERWGGVLPLLAAEFIVWVGFGAVLPVMPLYFTEHGIDLAMLGIVVAAWPAARLVGEPIFGWLADRTARVPLMVVGLVGTAAALAMPLLVVGPAAFVVARALAGLGTAIYDPAARGFLTDATPSGRRGEAFGLYGAAQMGGLLFGPAIGGFGAAAFGGLDVVFVLGAIATLGAALAVAARVRETGVRHHVPPAHDFAEFPAEPAGMYERMAEDLEADAAAGPGADRAPRSLWNRLLLAAILLNVGLYVAGGAYEVVWSLFLQARGAGLDFIGFTFALFALPALFVSPVAGRLVDRHGSFGFLVVGGLAGAIASISYPLTTGYLSVVPLLLLEATGMAVLSPALYAVVAAGSPPGRSSTAQGLFGAAGTLGTIVASVVTGLLAEVDLRYPFWIGGAVLFACLVAGLAIGGRPIRSLAGRRPQASLPAAPS